MTEKQDGEINNSDIEEGELPLEKHELAQTEKNKKTLEDSKKKTRKSRKKKGKTEQDEASEDETSKPKKKIHKEEKHSRFSQTQNNELKTAKEGSKNEEEESVEHADKGQNDTGSSKYETESELSDAISKKSSSFEIEYVQSHPNKQKLYRGPSSSQSSRMKSSSRSHSNDSYANKSPINRRRGNKTRRDQRANNDRRNQRKAGSYARDNKGNKRNQGNSDKSPNNRRNDNENKKYEEDPKMLYKVCKNYVRKNCKNGDRCPYSHNMKDYPCKYFKALGKCDRGVNCNYSHAPFPSTEHQNEFIRDNMEFLLEQRKKKGSLEIDPYFLPLIPPHLQPQQKPPFHHTPLIMNQPPLPYGKQPPPPQNSSHLHPSNAPGFFPGPPNHLPPGTVPPRPLQTSTNGMIMGAPPYPNIMGGHPINPPLSGHGFPAGPLPIMKSPQLMMGQTGQPPVMGGGSNPGGSTIVGYLNTQPNQNMNYFNPHTNMGLPSSQNPSYLPGAANMNVPPPPLQQSSLNMPSFHPAPIQNAAYQPYGGPFPHTNMNTSLIGGNYSNPASNLMNLPSTQGGNTPMVNNYNIAYNGGMSMGNTVTSQQAGTDYQRQQENYPGMISSAPSYKPPGFQGPNNSFDPSYNDRNMFQAYQPQAFLGQGQQQHQSANQGYPSQPNWVGQIPSTEPTPLINISMNNPNSSSNPLHLSSNANNNSSGSSTNNLNNQANYSSNYIQNQTQKASGGYDTYGKFNDRGEVNAERNSVQKTKAKEEGNIGEKLESNESEEKRIKKDEPDMDEKLQKQLAMKNTLKSLNVLKPEKAVENSVEKDSSNEKKGILKDLEEKLHSQLPNRQDLKVLVNKFFKSKDPRKQQQQEKMQKQLMKEKEEEKN